MSDKLTIVLVYCLVVSCVFVVAAIWQYIKITRIEKEILELENGIRLKLIGLRAIAESMRSRDKKEGEV